MLNPKRHEGQTTNLFDKRLNSKYESSMHNSAFTGVYIPPETVAHDQRTRNILPSWDMEAFHRSSAINPDYHSLRENVIRYDGRTSLLTFRIPLIQAKMDHKSGRRISNARNAIEKQYLSVLGVKKLGIVILSVRIGWTITDNVNE
ncbi:hypothetical protein GQR58_029149 [Nymphon striatum]|nr:hypothetical protein GQR58_029149 [Nymphon striatum]